ncbi:hypothetical protein M885DRAFT_520802 [Pelagophyceae sp. CCMP2097]|nr:hypothetical protein M885DRAFT_520802 [Pelagophyceae sp. CCMP2097]
MQLRSRKVVVRSATEAPFPPAPFSEMGSDTDPSPGAPPARASPTSQRPRPRPAPARAQMAPPAADKAPKAQKARPAPAEAEAALQACASMTAADKAPKRARRYLNCDEDDDDGALSVDAVEVGALEMGFLPSAETPPRRWLHSTKKSPKDGVLKCVFVGGHASFARICAARAVSRLWRRIASSEPVWAVLMQDGFPPGSEQLRTFVDAAALGPQMSAFSTFRLRHRLVSQRLRAPARRAVAKEYSALVELEVWFGKDAESVYSQVCPFEVVASHCGAAEDTLHIATASSFLDKVRDLQEFSSVKLTLTLLRHRDRKMCCVCDSAPVSQAAASRSWRFLHAPNHTNAFALLGVAESIELQDVAFSGDGALPPEPQATIKSPGRLAYKLGVGHLPWSAGEKSILCSLPDIWDALFDWVDPLEHATARPGAA